ncbi:unnamed protein product [Paramecium pentaurelia]|uniref:Protein kinase domain-containing protein n=1 Tax=Paramecium pentaurelia TaxID=43138 RepID=A0A8S1SGC4_9CILI|nr:unnamed protein product [Paramecium pentaurelia]
MSIPELHNLEYSQTQSKALSHPISFSKTSKIKISKSYIEIQDKKINKMITINIDDIKLMTWIKHEDFYEVTFQYKQNFQDKFIFDILSGTLGHQALVKKIAQDNFTENYEMLETIKRTQNGEIIKCRRRENNEVFVAKIQQNNHFLIERELQINLYLAENPHENVASMVEYYFENDQIILMYPYFSGGTLNQLVNTYANNISKLKVKSIMKKILSGLNHIHNLGIIHRDIKMDNIMIEEIDDHKCVKIIDFGFSAFKDNLSYLSEKCGTIGYFAPEIINGQFYNNKCDIYSLAQVFHMLLTGNPMFDRNMNTQQIIRLSKNNLFAIDYRNIKESKAQQLLFKMLDFQEKRYDVQLCLEHSYFFKAENLELKINNVRTFEFKSPF